MKTFEQRFKEKYVLEENKIFPNNPCWLWIGAKGRGYGIISFNGKARTAHRVWYELNVGQLKEGLELDHLCKNSLCVNPEHLEQVTHSENCRRGRHADVCRARGAKITHCPQGHEYSGDNLYVKPNGRRECKACVKASGVRYRERLKLNK